MKTNFRFVPYAVVVSLLAALQAGAQANSTRLTVGFAAILSEPKEEFRDNVSNGFGGGGGVSYNVDRPGVLSLRFDGSWVAYGHETKRVPFSETVGGRVLVDVKTTNSITNISFGPELASPSGVVRPYLNAAISRLFFRTTSSVEGIQFDNEAIASTTNHHDGTGAWAVGSGVRIPLGRRDSRVTLDLGVRYYRGGEASYLREGSIRDNPDLSITVVPLSSRTPFMVYSIGIRFRIPYNSTEPCPRLLC